MEKDLVVREVSPELVVEVATAQAKLLMDIVEKTNCYQEISGKKYLQVEAWETIGAFNRTHAETESITPILKGKETIGYQAHVQLWKDGVVVGGAIMPCYFTENCCKGKEGDAKHKSCMSAAQTFATSKAYRMNYSFVAILAGYQPLPAEELSKDMRDEVDKTQHYCNIHQVNFFMKGKMKSFGHPIEGTDPLEWCHEHKPKEKVADDTQAEKDLGHMYPDKPNLPFDSAWLTQSLTEVKWSENTVKSYLKNVYQVDTEGTVVDVVSRLNKEQMEQFFSEIQKRLDKPLG